MRDNATGSQADDAGYAFLSAKHLARGEEKVDLKPISLMT